MNLSKLTNPIVETAVSSYATPDVDTVTETPTESATIDSGADSRTVSSTIGVVAGNNNDGGAVGYDLNSEIDVANYGESAHADKNTKPTKERSSKEYKTLYNYLLEKYKNEINTSKVLEDFSLYLKRLAKYQQLRNTMLIDTLQYLDKHESFQSISIVDHSEVIKKLENIRKDNENMSPLILKLIELEKAELDNDSRSNLHSFHNIIGINDSLSSDLSIQENNISPDLFTNTSDFFELVKKNQCFENKIKTLMDLKAAIRAECTVENLSPEIQASRKRVRQPDSNSNPHTENNGLVSKTSGPGDSLKITIQRKKIKVEDERQPIQG